MLLSDVQDEKRRVDVDALLAAIDAMPPVSAEDGWDISRSLQQEALANGTAGMSMEEIDAEIAACRRESRVCDEHTLTVGIANESPLALATVG